MPWNSADDNAQRASDTRCDTRTPAQRRWDDRVYAVAESVTKLRALTYPDQTSWARNPRLLEAVSNIVSDMDRELKALRIDGYREGDSYGPLASIKPIASTVLPLATLSQVQAAE